MTRFTSVFIALVLICTLGISCKDNNPTAPKPSSKATVIVDRAPDTLSCSWQLQAPDSSVYSGTDDETLTNLEPGDYTLTWSEVSGWDSPDPAVQTQTVAAGGSVTFSGTYTVAVAETVSTPDAPGGPTTGVENQDLSYSASGAVSSYGEDVEYRFDWGNSTSSDWGTTAVQNSWATAGTYEVKAQARCIAHPTVISDWSAATTVTITVYVAETVSTPDAPTGSTTNEVGQSSSYTTSGAVSSYGDDLHYRFDWGDGNLSIWSVYTSETHSWATEGSYDVKAQARCAVHTTVESEWSTATAVTITAAAVETISAPDAPGGPASGETSESLTYTASGAVSSFGHLVEYRFDFGDGTITGWLSTLTSSSHVWNTAGSYDVIVQARCRTHTTIESAWSDATAVVISDPAEIIPNPPGAISGVTAGIINDPYEYIVYHSSQTNLGNAIEGQFDWGDGTFSDWITPGPFSASHTWPTEGTYIVRYLARCSIHNDVSASADSLIVTITTTAVETISKPGYVNYSYDLRHPEINIERLYRAYGGVSSLGHAQEVKFDWGDGTESDWIPELELVSKTWTVAGTYPMTRQSRCAIHTDIVSEWSDPIYIYAKDPETVSTPDAPPGPTTGTIYQNLYYTATGAASNWHTGYIEYRFDWGDGSAFTEWSADTIQVHQFTAFGDYEVKTQARCSYPGHTAPDSDWSLPTTVSIVEQVIASGGPDGPVTGTINLSYTFEAGSANSNAGHALEYQFDWGDGTFSDWSSSDSAEHAYTAAGTFNILYRARCAVHTEIVSEWSSETHTIEITDDPESINTPLTPFSSSPATVGTERSFNLSGSFSNYGDPIEYQVDFGDGTISDWTLGYIWITDYRLTMNHTYTSIGTYDVTCKARCAIHTDVESDVSPAFTMNIVEAIEIPATPTGPATGVLGANLTFTTTGATSSEGHDLEYQFEYRLGYPIVYTSDWSASLSDDHVFTTVGTNYSVSVRARCATHTDAVSSSSEAFYFTITE